MGDQRFVVDVFLRLVFERDFISPPLSSKIIKFLIDSGRFLGFLRDLSLSRDKYKLLFISNLYSSEGLRIYSSGSGGGSSPRVLVGGVEYFGRVSFVSSSDVLGEVLNASSAKIDFEYGSARNSVYIEVVSVEVSDLDHLSIDLSNKILIRFITPTILSPKLMMPPSLSDKPKYKRLPVANLLMPVPGVLIAYTMKLWNNAAPPQKKFTYPNDKDDIYVYKTAVLGTIFTEVINIRVIPETIIIGRDEKDKIRKTKGFRGHVIMKINHPRIRRVAEKTLALAKHLGVGRSRGLGLGEIDIRKI